MTLFSNKGFGSTFALFAEASSFLILGLCCQIVNISFQSPKIRSMELAVVYSGGDELDPCCLDNGLFPGTICSPSTAALKTLEVPNPKLPGTFNI